MSNQDFLELLRQRFREKKRRNKSYSLRAFAVYLKVDQSTLSKVFRGEKNFSPLTNKRILSLLLDDPSTVRKNNAELDRSSLSSIDIWSEVVILEFVKLRGPSCAVKDLYASLVLPAATVEDSLQRLVQFGVLELRDDSVHLISEVHPLGDQLSSVLMDQKLLTSLLRHNLLAVKTQAKSRHALGAVTLAISADQLEGFRQKIKETVEAFIESPMDVAEAKEVYQITLSLFPLTKP